MQFCGSKMLWKCNASVLLRSFVQFRSQPMVDNEDVNGDCMTIPMII